MRQAIFLTLLIAAGAWGQSSTLALNPNSIAAATGQEFTVQVVFLPAATDPKPVLGCTDAAVGYDPKALQFLAVRFPQSEVPLADEERRPALLTSSQPNSSGHVRFQRVSLGDGATERKLSGDGPVVVAILHFRARAEGSTPLLITSNMLCDVAGNALPARTVGAFVGVTNPPPQ